ncbi:MAG TPA: alpha/beta fold hydrolase [Acidimicrobiales bacterium]|jgi:2-succinyl-6-hydroxy-2,4-cyclohexadiene-1-carboxylate synthase|nr:alpha/beta fold hydrolase [Acidimicrobiales bacterium]
MALLAAAHAGEGPTVVLLHGFTQTASSMGPIAERLAATRHVVAVDLPGHGGSASVRADLDGAAALVVDAAGDGPFDLVGYSLGGRIALHVACAAPAGLGSTVAISASPGIADAAARHARLERDLALADQLEADGDVEGFLARWLANPLFATLRAERADLAGRAAANTAAGLVDSLRRCSVGTQRWLGDELARLDRPLLFLSGARDDAFVASACAVAARSRVVAVGVVPGAGHVAHLEQPDVTVRLLESVLTAP